MLLNPGQREGLEIDGKEMGRDGDSEPTTLTILFPNSVPSRSLRMSWVGVSYKYVV